METVLRASASRSLREQQRLREKERRSLEEERRQLQSESRRREAGQRHAKVVQPEEQRKAELRRLRLEHYSRGADEASEKPKHGSSLAQQKGCACLPSTAPVQQSSQISAGPTSATHLPTASLGCTTTSGSADAGQGSDKATAQLEQLRQLRQRQWAKARASSQPLQCPRSAPVEQCPPSKMERAIADDLPQHLAHEKFRALSCTKKRSPDLHRFFADRELQWDDQELCHKFQNAFLADCYNSTCDPEVKRGLLAFACSKHNVFASTHNDDHSRMEKGFKSGQITATDYNQKAEMLTTGLYAMVQSGAYPDKVVEHVVREMVEHPGGVYCRVAAELDARNFPKMKQLIMAARQKQARTPSAPSDWHGCVTGINLHCSSLGHEVPTAHPSLSSLSIGSAAGRKLSRTRLRRRGAE